MEYDRLEQELEELNTRMDALRMESQEQALHKQQLEGQINVLNEQILAGVQNDAALQGPSENHRGGAGCKRGFQK